MLCVCKNMEKFSGNQSERFLSNSLNHGVDLRQKQQISDASEIDRQIVDILFWWKCLNGHRSRNPIPGYELMWFPQTYRYILSFPLCKNMCIRILYSLWKLITFDRYNMQIHISRRRQVFKIFHFDSSILATRNVARVYEDVTKPKHDSSNYSYRFAANKKNMSSDNWSRIFGPVTV